MIENHLFKVGLDLYKLIKNQTLSFFVLFTIISHTKPQFSSYPSSHPPTLPTPTSPNPHFHPPLLKGKTFHGDSTKIGTLSSGKTKPFPLCRWSAKMPAHLPETDPSPTARDPQTDKVTQLLSTSRGPNSVQCRIHICKSGACEFPLAWSVVSIDFPITVLTTLCSYNPSCLSSAVLLEFSLLFGCRSLHLFHSVTG